MRIRMFVKVIAGLAMVLALAAPAAAQGTTGNSGVLFGVGVSFLNAEVVDDDSDTMTGFSLDFRKNVYSTASVDIGVTRCALSAVTVDGAGRASCPAPMPRGI